MLGRAIAAEKMKSPTLCLHCGRPYPPSDHPPAKLPVRGVVRQALVNFVASRPGGVSREEIMETLYGDANRERANLLHANINLANRDLGSRGYRIWCEGGRGSRKSRYYLGRTERGPSGQPPA